MNKTLWQRLMPHAIAVGIFFLVSVFYCLPALQGMVVGSTDVLSWKAMAQQSFEFKEKYGHYPLWTNSLFSGMPAFQIMAEPEYNVTIAYLHYLLTLFLPMPAGLFFLACISFYILTVVLKLRNWIGIFGSLSYAFASYNAILVATGHTTKFASMGYAPAVLAGLILLTQRKYVIGFLVTFVFTTLLFYQNHIQILYYTLLIAVCLGISYAIHAIKRKEGPHLLKIAGLAALAGAISFASYAVTLFSTYDYSLETMRGGRSELTGATTPTAKKENKSKGGLDRSYAFHWSYGIDETLTLMLPTAKGGSSGPRELGENGKTIEALQESQLPQEAVSYFYNYLSAYWGTQPFTSGPVYFGALVCLFFIAGLFLIRSWHLGWIVAASILGIIMSWGGNLPLINNFLFDYLPFYNKFRAPSMALVIPQLTFALLASMALQEILYGEHDKKVLLKKLKLAGIATGVVLVLLAFNYINSDFRNENDKRTREAISQVTEMASRGNQNAEQVKQLASTNSTAIVNGVVNDRRSLYGSDLLRAVIFVLLGAALAWLVIQKKIKAQWAAIGLVVLNLFDLVQVDLRYLSKGNYVPKDEFLDSYAPNRADIQIKQDTGYYRVFDQSGGGNPFEDPRASYHHNSVGGYHPAKLGLYDDIIQNQLQKGNMAVFNMLNTKYFITSNPTDRQPMAQQNPGAMGAAWAVKAIRYVNNADEEMKALDSLHPADTVVIDKREQSKIPFPPQYDSSTVIQLVKNMNDNITYQFNSPKNQFIVFSEIYYPRGWKALIDGKETEIVKANYVLRGLPVTAGKHTIEFKFEPASFLLGSKISLVIGILSFLILGWGIWYEWKRYKKQNTSVAGKV